MFKLRELSHPNLNNTPPGKELWHYASMYFSLFFFPLFFIMGYCIQGLALHVQFKVCSFWRTFPSASPPIPHEVVVMFSWLLFFNLALFYFSQSMAVIKGDTRSLCYHNTSFFYFTRAWSIVLYLIWKILCVFSSHWCSIAMFFVLFYGTVKACWILPFVELIHAQSSIWLGHLQRCRCTLWTGVFCVMWCHIIHLGELTYYNTIPLMVENCTFDITVLFSR